VIFDDRADAGRRLALLLGHLAAEEPVVLALPRGGVPVAVEVAAALRAELDVLAVRKLGAPGNREFAIGAIAEGGSVVLDAATAARLGVAQEDLDRVLRREVAELRRRIDRFRQGSAPADLRGRTVVIVDDGLATGLTDLAAVRAARRGGATRIVVAAPVGSREALVLLRREADEVVCHSVPRELLGVGRWYRDFSPVPDREAMALLAEARAGSPPAPPRRARDVAVDAGAGLRLPGELAAAIEPWGLAVLADANGGTATPALGRRLNDAGLTTLMIDLATAGEREEGRMADPATLAGRLLRATRGLAREPETRGLPVGWVAGPGAAEAVLTSAAAPLDEVRAVVVRDGRPGLAEALAEVRIPTLLLVEGDAAAAPGDAGAVPGPHRIVRLAGAAEPLDAAAARDEAGRLAVNWLGTHLPVAAAPAAAAG
jgi:putative phosphoribosyl transferase